MWFAIRQYRLTASMFGEVISRRPETPPDKLVLRRVWICYKPFLPFLGASPDGAAYDPSNQYHPFGFVEIKCPYSARDKTPLEAAANPSFCCSSTSSTLTLKRHHAYYAQIQGQMAIGERPWCDFVIYTSKGLSIQRILFDSQYWNENFPKLKSFYDNCIAPECVSPLHSVELPKRKLTV